MFLTPRFPDQHGDNALALNLDILILSAAALLLIIGLRSSRRKGDMRMFILAVICIVIRTTISLAIHLHYIEGANLVLARDYLMTFFTGCATGAFVSLLISGGFSRLVSKQLE